MTITYTSAIASDLFPNGGWDVHHHIFDRMPQNLFPFSNLSTILTLTATQFTYPPTAT